MNLDKLFRLIPEAGTKEIYVTVHHKTMGRGRLYLMPYDCPDDHEGGEGVIQFEPDSGEGDLFMGLIEPCHCGREDCDAFVVRNPDLCPQEFENAFAQLIMSAGTVAAC